MLLNSFSYLPVFKDKQWHLVSDFALTKYLKGTEGKEKRTRLSRNLEDALKLEQIGIKAAKTVYPECFINELLEGNWEGLPLCVVSENSTEIIGILTPFDLL